MTRLRVQELAEERRLNITTLARKAKLAYNSTWRVWHNDVKQLDMRTLDRLALALSVRVSDLFEGAPDEHALDDPQ